MTCRTCGAEIRLAPHGFGHVAPQVIRKGKKPHRAMPAPVKAAVA